MRNRILQLFTFSILLLQLISCREDIEFSGNYRETPVVYCLLDQSEETHYVKINRGFLGPGNALEFAKIEDSNRFESVEAYIYEFIEGSVTRSWLLRDTVLNNKEDGAFFGPAHTLYYFETTEDEPLLEEATYKMEIDINDGTLEVKGETKLVQGFGSSKELSNIAFSVAVADDIDEYKADRIVFNRGNATFANSTVMIQIAEFRGAEKTIIEIPWFLVENTTTQSEFKSPLVGELFYETIRDGVTDDPTITKRNYEGVRMVLTAGDADFYNYIQVAKPSTSLAQTKPSFTNLTVSEGFEVVGLFAARHTVVYNKPFILTNNDVPRSLNKKSTRNLCYGEHTNDLLFCSQHAQDISNDEEYACN